LNGDRPAKQLGTVRDVERMQPLKIGPCIPRHRDQIDDAVRASSAIDNRCRSNSDFGSDLAATSVVAGSLTRPQERDLPEHRARVGIESVQAVMLSWDKENIMCLP